jgi:LysR family glycine cleavage system transcriptional activator
MRQLPPLSGLQAFEAAARHLSFTDAARELNCTQAAISQRVRALEDYLSRQLFLRKSNGLLLSEAGEAYLPGVAEALNVAAAATEGLRGRRMARAVTLSAPVSFLTLWLNPRLDALLSAVPNVELRLNSAIWHDPNAELADIVVQVQDVAELDARTPQLPPERLMLVASPSLGPDLSACDLADVLAGIRRIEIQGRHDLWQRWSRHMNIEPPGALPSLKVDNAVAALEAAAQGLGVTVAYATYCEPYVAASRLVAPEHAACRTGLSHALTGVLRQPSWHPAHKVFSHLAGEFRREAASR